jgi:hypothetical protein
MHLNRGKIAFATVWGVATYWATTYAMIENAAYQIAYPSPYCVSFFPPVNHGAFLEFMGDRALPVIQRRQAEPTLSPSGKMRLAWVAYEMGDKSQFSDFVAGLSSSKSRDRYAAIGYLGRELKECLNYLPAILDAGRTPQPSRYQSLLAAIAYKANLGDDKASLVNDIIWEQDGRVLNPERIQRILALFEPERTAQVSIKSDHSSRFRRSSGLGVAVRLSLPPHSLSS